MVALTIRLCASMPQKSSICDRNDVAITVFYDSCHGIESIGMTEVQTRASSALFGGKGHTSVSRGLGEFQGGRPVLISATGQAVLALPVEGLDVQRLAEFMALCRPVVPRLVITEQRALALGLDASTPMALALSGREGANAILALVTEATSSQIPQPEPASSVEAAAVQLVKLSESLPAVLAANITDGIAQPERLVRVEADAVARFADDAIRSLVIASEASVPLNSGTPARFVVFRDAMGGSPVAVIVGQPDFTN